MCGIVGYVGDKQAAPILLEGLAKLEYRGYDSAGIAVDFDNKLSAVGNFGVYVYHSAFSAVAVDYRICNSLAYSGFYVCNFIYCRVKL